jgi:spore coat protein U-like protein
MMIERRRSMFDKLGIGASVVSMRKVATLAMILAGCVFAATTSRAGTASANLTVQMTVTASCTINAATLTFPSVAGTSLTSTPATGNTTLSVTCTNGSPYAIGMGQGLNFLGGLNRMVSSGNFLPYGLYLDAAYTQPWTTAADNNSCTIVNGCYLGTGSGSAQTVPIYGQVPTIVLAPAAGTYSDTVSMTVTY